MVGAPPGWYDAPELDDEPLPMFGHGWCGVVPGVVVVVGVLDEGAVVVPPPAAQAAPAPMAASTATVAISQRSLSISPPWLPPCMQHPGAKDSTGKACESG